MRNIFNSILLDEAKRNPNIFFLTADLGYNAFEEFQITFKDRFINCGVAENNMIGMATGLALKGKKVFVYSIIPFLIHRSFEQIKNNIAITNLDIKLIGAGGGFSYAEQGVSHNPTEDLAIMNTLPNISIYSPSSKHEANKSIKAMIKHKKPSYIRLTKMPEFNFIPKHKDSSNKPVTVKKGNKVLIISTGNILENVVNSLDLLSKNNIIPTILSYYQIKPIDQNYLIQVSNEYEYIFTVEEHSIIGGLGSIINNILIRSKKNNIKVTNIALQDKAHVEIGSQKYLQKINKLDSKSIAKTVLGKIK